MAMPAGGNGRKELSSWKEVAEYLGVSVRTAQKWENERGLPVRRFSGEKGRVLADPDRLDRWREGILERPQAGRRPGFFRVWAATASAVLLVAAVAWLLANRKGPPALFRHDLNSLIVTDAGGRELWRWAFPDPFQAGQTPDDLLASHQAWLGDLDGDGRIELLYTYVPTTIEKHGRTLFCFSEDGRER
ncbi:MAG: helix-turn-helix domain-containing protein, partial [Acidobacteria bacterium]|nr:helix-turn-helix domain-containing protein [Acidobacteriota bacterium]